MNIKTLIVACALALTAACDRVEVTNNTTQPGGGAPKEGGPIREH